MPRTAQRQPSATTRRTSSQPLETLKQRLQEASDVAAAAAVLSWDQSTYMPSAGAAARGRQLAQLSTIAHAKRTHPDVGNLLTKAERHVGHLDPDSDDARFVAVARRDFDRAVRVPADLVAEASAAASASYAAWIKARPNADFKTMQPHLERALELQHRFASLFEHEHVLDPLIGPDEGVTTADIKVLFSGLRKALVPLVKSITAQQEASDACLRKHFPEAAQIAFSMQVACDMGYDLTRGRLDKTAHPFMTRFGADDVRITTRVNERDLGDCMFSVWHEAGHAFYELGVAKDLPEPLAGGTSSGVHESQSRLWENIVGRSRGFWEHYYPALQAAFPDQLKRVPLNTFHRAINKVSRSLIRTDADEVTYNLHVMIRFELECDLFEGRLAIKDLADAWQAVYRRDLGVEAPSHADGVLQDVHWYAGGLGGSFQSYTIGNILSVQFYDAAVKAHPGIPEDIKSGRFRTLHDWLGSNIYRHGRKFDVHKLVKRATGAPISTTPYLAYLKSKYGNLYGT